MRASTCLAAAVISTAAGGVAPGALAFHAPAPARGSSNCGQQGASGAFCRGSSSGSSGSVTAPGARDVITKGVSSVWGDASARRRGVEALSMSTATKAEKKAPWLDGDTPSKLPDEISAENPLRVVIAGGGVGGLLAAKYLKMQGYDVSSFMMIHTSAVITRPLHDFAILYRRKTLQLFSIFK